MLGSALRAGLRQDGHAVDWVRSAGEADSAWLAAGASAPFDAVVLDLGLPDGTGLGLLSSARGRGLTTPVIIATARDRIADRIAGLDAGADDYMVKPIDLDELNARLRALERRVGGRAAPQIKLGDIVIEPSTRRVTEGRGACRPHGARDGGPARSRPPAGQHAVAGSARRGTVRLGREHRKQRRRCVPAPFAPQTRRRLDRNAARPGLAPGGVMYRRHLVAARPSHVAAHRHRHPRMGRKQRLVVPQRGGRSRSPV